MLIGPVLALLLFVLLYKRDVNPAGTVWIPPELRNQPQPSPAQRLGVEQTLTAQPREPLDLDDVFRRRS